MPELDGVQTTRFIRKNELKTKKHIPIIAITAHALQGDREKFLDEGMDEYISKPYQMNDLISTISKLLYNETDKNLETVVDNKELTNKSDDPFLKTEFQPEAPIYKIGDIKQQIEKLKLAIESNDISYSEKLAHSIKLLATQILATNVQNIAFKIELALRKSNQEDALELFKKLESEASKVLINI